MARYLLKRVLQIIPVLLILTFIIFCPVYVAGDPVALMLPPEAGEEAKEALREALGLNKPFLEQFFIYLGNLLRGNFGVSYQYNQDALSLVLERMPYSLQLAGVSLLASVAIGIVLGIAAAQFRNTPFDLLVNGFAALGQADVYKRQPQARMVSVACARVIPWTTSPCTEAAAPSKL